MTRLRTADGAGCSTRRKRSQVSASEAVRFGPEGDTVEGNLRRRSAKGMGPSELDPHGSWESTGPR